ncbi:MAG: hypothetical protein NTZ63_05715 [Candidatus Omnitrophica bacterium]|nr:hypothetical protein [Candidatus Omnitrophota bacterium]
MLEKSEVLGVGWIRQNSFGLSHKGLRNSYSDQKSLYELLRKESILAYPVENFSRFDSSSKNTLLGIALALYDAGVTYSKEKKQNIAILATNESGSMDANHAYFKDYVENGRTLGRGNLFIYTLPSSPLAESAIHFGLTGPLLYLGFDQKPFPRLLGFTKDMIGQGKVKLALAVKTDINRTLCFVLGNKK